MIDQDFLCKVIDKAREILGPNGSHWTRDAYYRDVGGETLDDADVETPGDEHIAPVVPQSFCILGSIRYASFLIDPQVSPEVTEAAFTQIAIGYREFATSLVQFNDDIVESFDPIAGVLDATKALVCAQPNELIIT